MTANEASATLSCIENLLDILVTIAFKRAPYFQNLISVLLKIRSKKKRINAICGNDARCSAPDQERNDAVEGPGVRTNIPESQEIPEIPG
jgi:hypothetical protein